MTHRTESDAPSQPSHVQTLERLYDTANDALVSRDVWVERAMKGLRFGIYADAPSQPSAKRLPDPKAEGEFPEGFSTRTMCYWRDRGVWWLYLPGGGVGNLTNHDITEHEDGTITVSPSILVTSRRGERRRHGYLKRGVWEPCGDDIAPTVSEDA